MAQDRSWCFVSHSLEELARRHFVLSISRTCCRLPDDVWSSEKLLGNSIGRFWFPNKKIRG